MAVVLNAYAIEPTYVRKPLSDLSFPSWFIHHVDRWPDTGAYGAHYLFADCKHTEILKVDDQKGILYLKNGVALEIGDAESDRGLFDVIMAKPWDEVYKARWKGDDDYTDYAPRFIRNAKDLAEGKGETYGLD
jgi:hypothetical protein